jgi:apolipoprotein N-acyltransferase
LASKRAVLPVLGLLTYVLSFPLVNLWFLAFFCLVPLLFYIREKTGFGAFWRFFALASVFHLVRLYWILSLEVDPQTKRWLWAGFLVMVVYLSLYFGMFGWLASKLMGRARPILLVFLLPSLWVLLEFVKGSFYTGFPWSTLWLTQVGNLPFAQLAAHVGPYGVSWLLMASNAWLFWVLSARHRIVPGALCWLAVLFVLHIVGALRLQGGSGGKTVRVAVIQPDFLAETPGLESWEYIERTYDSLSREIEGEMDLIVLSESALPGLYERSGISQGIIRRIQEHHRAPVLLGTVDYEDENLYNAAMLVDSGSSVMRRYWKSHPVPFGEWLPYEHRIPLLTRLQFGQGDYRPGTGGRPIAYDDMNFGVLICFESIFPYISRAYARSGAEFLVTITSDGLFGRSLGPREHFELARFQAIQTDRYMVRCAKRGISGIIDPRGRVLERIGLFRKGVLTAQIRTSDRSTLYARTGDLAAWLSLLILGAWIAARVVRSKRKPESA